MNNIMKILCLVSLLLVGFSAHAEVTVEYGLTGVVQALDKNADLVTTDGVGSLDLAVDVEIGSGVLHMFVEGASDAAGSAAENIDGVNADAGTAADANGKGRLQLSELSYVFGSNGYSVAIGVQNLFAFVDANSTSNAETEQFLAGSLVNNPTIAMPDYTVSAVLNYGDEDKTNATFMVANGYGLADNASADYNDLVDFGNTPAGLNKGVFALGEVRIEDQDVWLSVGAWSNSREVDPLSGYYFNLDSAADESFAWSLRLGQNDDTAGMVSFGSFSTAFTFGSDVLGVGVAMHNYPATAVGVEDPTVVETYYRWQLTDSLAITPDVQFWQNANGITNPPVGVAGGDTIVYGIRLQYGDSATF